MKVRERKKFKDIPTPVSVRTWDFQEPDPSHGKGCPIAKLIPYGLRMEPNGEFGPQQQNTAGQLPGREPNIHSVVLPAG